MGRAGARLAHGGCEVAPRARRVRLGVAAAAEKEQLRVVLEQVTHAPVGLGLCIRVRCCCCALLLWPTYLV